MCLAAIVLGGNWAVFDRFGSDMPDWDQWDAECRHLLVPWFEGGDFLRQLFTPHNEHRVVLTKVQNLVVTLLGGQWDARVEAFFNAILHAAIAVGLWIGARRQVGSRLQPLLYALIAALYALPLAWQNVLGGFHSQQYWLIGLSFTAIALWPFARAWSVRWWLGAMAGFLALGSMGSGFLAAAMVCALVVLRLARRDVTPRAAGPTLVVSAAFVLLGWLTRVERDYHAHLKAANFHDFFLSFGRSLEWPLHEHEWAGPFLWAPWAVLAGTVLSPLRRRAPGATMESASLHHSSRTELEMSHVQLTIAGLGGWVIVQLLATAYARGAGGGHPASRYMDTLIFGTAVNAWALGLLLSKPAPRHFTRRIAGWALGAAWLSLVAWGGAVLLRANFTDDLPNAKSYYERTEPNVRAYVLTNDPADLIEPLPYPSAAELAERLSHRSIRALLPQSVRAPGQIAVAQAEGFGTGIVTPRRASDPAPNLPADLAPPLGRRYWSSLTGDNASTTGSWQTEPLTYADARWLRFDIAMSSGAADIAIELVSPKGSTIVQSTAADRGGWHRVYVRAPAEPFVIAVADRDRRAWVAFTEPVEVTSLSYWTMQIMASATLLIVAAAAAIGLLLLACPALRNWLSPSESGS